MFGDGKGRRGDERGVGEKKKGNMNIFMLGVNFGGGWDGKRKKATLGVGDIRLIYFTFRVASR
jgi:hypothetical protein